MIKYFFIALFLFFTGFFCFLGYVLLLKDTYPDHPIDSIIVFSGGKGRIAKGFSLQEKLNVPLFISGVGDGVDSAVLESRYNDGKSSKNLILGHEALDTEGNALESNKWIREYHLKNICLLTSAYHIPRSLLVLSRAPIPEGVHFYICPYYFESVSLSNLYNFLRLCFLEYCRLIVIFIKS